MIPPQATIIGPTTGSDGYYDAVTSNGSTVSAVSILRATMTAGQTVSVIQCGDEYGVVALDKGLRGALAVPSDARSMTESQGPASVALSSIGRWASLVQRVYVLGQIVSVGAASLVVDLLDGPFQGQRITTSVDTLLGLEAADFSASEKIVLRAWPDTIPVAVGWWETGGTLLIVQLDIGGTTLPVGFEPPFSKNNVAVSWVDVESGLPPEEWPSDLVLTSYDQDLGTPTTGFNYSNFDREAWSTGGTYYDPGNISVTAKGHADARCGLLRVQYPDGGTTAFYLCMLDSSGFGVFRLYAQAAVAALIPEGFDVTFSTIDLSTPFIARVGHVPGEEYYDPNLFYFVFGVDEISKTGEEFKATLNLDPMTSLCSLGY